MTASPQELHWARFREDPDDRAAFEMLEEHLFMEADWPALADLYRRRRAAPSLAERPRARAELSMRLAQLCEDRLADADSAIQAYTEAFRLDATQRRALKSLRRIYGRRRSWEAVLQIGEQEVVLAESGEERARILSEMGDIWKRELGDAHQAEELYARAREESGGAPAARGAEQAPTRAAGGDETPEDVGALVQRAWLAAARGDTSTALEALGRALARDPADLEALDMMLGVLEGAERHAEMVPLLERRAALAADAETRGAVLVRLGQLLEQAGGVGDARDAYERALAARPRDAAARGALLRIYRATEAWSPLRSLLEAASDVAEGSERIELLHELASVLAEELHEPDAAREVLDAAALLAPDDPRFQSRPDGGEEVALTMPEWEAEPPIGEQRSTRVVGVLERKLAAREAEGEGLAPAALALRLRIAELRARALGEPAEAVAVLEPALADAAALREVAPMLAGLYEQLGRMDPLIELAEGAAQACDDGEGRVYWRRRAVEAARAIGDSARAVACLRGVLADRPRDRAARSALMDLHRSRGEAEPLVALLREELCGADPERELELHSELAMLAAEALGDAAGAVAHLRRCLELEPESGERLEHALTTCAAHGGAEAQLDLLDHVLACADDAPARAALLARRGDLLANALAWHAEAEESWREALALDPGQRLARERLGAAAAAR